MLKKTALLAVLCIAPAAFAQNNRSAVSSTGLDTNPCTVPAPCRSFGAAIAETTPSGEIIALDSAGYGPFSVGRAVTISGAPGTHAAITVTSGTGIVIGTAAGDRVILRNLVLIGSGGDKGIDSSTADVRVLNCLIRGFVQVGVFASSGELVVDHSSVLDQSAGIGVVAGDGRHAEDLTLTHSLVEGNDTGVFVNSEATAMIVGSTIASGSFGVKADAVPISTSPPANATLEGNTIAFNTVGVETDAAAANTIATVYLSHNVISYNGTGLQIKDNAVAFSFGNNRFSGNGSDGDSPAAIAFK